MTLTNNETVSVSGGNNPLSRLAAAPATGDHKAIGRLWIASALGFGLLSLVLGVIVAIERASGTGSIDLGGLIQGFESYEQFFTLHRFGLVFLVIVPLFIGLATHVVPLQVGASSVAFPRAANAAFWTWLISATIMVVSWAIDGGFVPGGSIDAVNLSLASFAFVLISLMVGSVVIATTVLTQRVEGLWLERLPLFSWSMLVAAGIWLFSLPVLLANVVIVWIDHQGDAVGELGQGANMYAQFAWAFDHPQIFAFMIPLLGIVGDIIPTTFGERPRLHAVSQGAIGAFGILSFGAYAQSFFSPGAVSSPVYVLTALLLALPVLVLAGGWGDLARRSDSRNAGAHVAMATAALLLLLAGGAVAGLRVLYALLRPFVKISALNLSGTTASSALFTLVTAAGLAAAGAALYFWAPKLFGRKLNAGLAGLASLLFLGGGIVAGATDLISGFLDQSDDQVSMAARGVSVGGGVEALNWIAMLGTAGLLGGVALTLLNLLASTTRSIDDDYWEDQDSQNPWGGTTLEWATASPPPRGNFAAPITVGSESPILDMASGEK